MSICVVVFKPVLMVVLIAIGSGSHGVVCRSCELGRPERRFNGTGSGPAKDRMAERNTGRAWNRWNIVIGSVEAAMRIQCNQEGYQIGQSRIDTRNSISQGSLLKLSHTLSDIFNSVVCRLRRIPPTHKEMWIEKGNNISIEIC